MIDLISFHRIQGMHLLQRGLLLVIACIYILTSHFGIKAFATAPELVMSAEKVSCIASQMEELDDQYDCWQEKSQVHLHAMYFGERTLIRVLPPV